MTWVTSTTNTQVGRDNANLFIQHDLWGVRIQIGFIDEIIKAPRPVWWARLDHRHRDSDRRFLRALDPGMIGYREDQMDRSVGVQVFFQNTSGKLLDH